MRLIDADKLSQIIETMYLGSDTKENHRGCAETEDTMIGKFQVIDTIFEMPTVDVNGLIIAELEKIKAELEEIRMEEPLMSRGYECYGFKDKTPEDIKTEVIELLDERISGLKGE